MFIVILGCCLIIVLWLYRTYVECVESRQTERLVTSLRLTISDKILEAFDQPADGKTPEEVALMRDLYIVHRSFHETLNSGYISTLY